MKYEIEKEKVDELIDMIKEFDKLLTERISDLYEIKGMMQARHAYVFYRKLLWEIKDTLLANLEPDHELNKLKNGIHPLPGS